MASRWLAGLALLALAAGCAQPLPPLTGVPSTPTPSAPSTPTEVPTPGAARVWSGHTGPVTNLAWAPAGRLLASSSGDLTGDSDTTVRLWRADGSPVATLRGSTGAVFSLVWSP